VLNEPFDNHDVMDILGRGVMVDWFELAQQAAPEARLYINDYAILAAGGRTDTAHQAYYEDTIRFLLEQGAPLEGIGMQGHFGENVTPPETVLQLLDRFGQFGLPIQITEFDVDTRDEQLQADYTRDFMTAVFSHPAVNGFVMWGFWEGAHWRPESALFRRDWSERPNAAAYRERVFDRWRTEVEAVTDGEGRITTRGFLGDYTAKIQPPSASATEFEFLLPKGGTSKEIVLPDRIR